MNYLLDTNACIALINGTPPAVRKRLQRATGRGATIAVSSISTFELWYGVAGIAKSARQEVNTGRLQAFLAGPLELLAFEDEDAQTAGAIRAALEVRGAPIGAYDVLIAGQALRSGATLVTANGREFSRIAGLAWEDWASSR